MTGPEPDLDALTAAIVLLSAEYEAAMPGRITDIRRALESARPGGAAGRAELVDELHRLAGTAGTFGHPEMSDRARGLEIALRARRPRRIGSGPTAREARVLDDVSAFADELAARFPAARAAG
jgi:HPt (histidine-containing phosphotransfer) domain-containing protein